MRTSTRRTLRMQVLLLVLFVGGSIAWVLVATPVVARVMGLLGEGPFEITVHNQSRESLVVHLEQVGATSGRDLELPPTTAVGAGWSSCADTVVTVVLGSRVDAEVSRQRFVVCDGDVVTIGEDLTAALS